MFSSYIAPETSALDLVLSDVSQNVIIAKDYNGMAYLPSWYYNAIGDLNNQQGYQIKMAAADSVVVSGDYLLPEENPVELPLGWYIMGYLRTEPVAMDVLMADIESSIIIIKDYNGMAYLPSWFYNAIGDAVPGQGYQVKTSEPATLEYLSNDQSYRLSPLKRTNNKPIFFPTVERTGNNMTVIIEDHAWDIVPKEGVEIAAMDPTNNIVGSAKYTSPTTVITLWGDDKYTTKKEGLDINEQVQFKLWDKEQIRDFVIKDWEEGSSAYQINAINIASTIATGNSLLEEDNASTKSLVRIINILGQEVHEEDIERKGSLLFKVYDDGSVEKFIK